MYKRQISTIAIGLISFANTPQSNANFDSSEEFVEVADTVKKKKRSFKERINKTKRNLQKAATGEIAPKQESKSGLTIGEEGVEEGKEAKKKKEEKK